MWMSLCYVHVVVAVAVADTVDVVVVDVAVDVAVDMHVVVVCDECFVIKRLIVCGFQPLTTVDVKRRTIFIFKNFTK